jgi:hypothetical protein
LKKSINLENILENLDHFVFENLENIQITSKLSDASLLSSPLHRTPYPEKNKGKTIFSITFFGRPAISSILVQTQLLRGTNSVEIWWAFLANIKNVRELLSVTPLPGRAGVHYYDICVDSSQVSRNARVVTD